MKKMIAVLMLSATVLLTLAGCGKTEWALTIDGACDIVTRPVIAAPGGFGWQEMPDGTRVADLNLSKDGEYTMVVADEAGNQYNIVVVKTGGNLEVKADEGITCEVTKK